MSGEEPAPEWLDAEATWQRWGQTESEQKANYRDYVEQGLLRELASPLSEATAGSILGSEAFVEQVKRQRLLGEPLDEREQPALRRLQGAFEPEEVLSAVAGLFGISEEKIVERRGCCRKASRLAIYCTERFCRSGHSQTALCRLFGIQVSAFGAARAKFQSALAKDPALAEEVAAVAERLAKPGSALCSKNTHEMEV